MGMCHNVQEMKRNMNTIDQFVWAAESRRAMREEIKRKEAFEKEHPTTYNPDIIGCDWGMAFSQD